MVWKVLTRLNDLIFRDWLGTVKHKVYYLIVHRIHS